MIEVIKEYDLNIQNCFEKLNAVAYVLIRKSSGYANQMLA